MLYAVLDEVTQPPSTATRACGTCSPTLLGAARTVCVHTDQALVRQVEFLKRSDPFDAQDYCQRAGAVGERRRGVGQLFSRCVGFKYDNFYGDPPHFCITNRDGHFLMLAKADDPARSRRIGKSSTACGTPTSGSTTPRHPRRTRRGRGKDRLRPGREAVRHPGIRHPGPRWARHRLRAADLNHLRQIHRDAFLVVADVHPLVGERRRAPDDGAAEGVAGRLEDVGPAEFLVAFRREVGDDEVAVLGEQPDSGRPGG